MSEAGEATPVEVLGLGAVAVDDVLHVDRYPPPDEKVPVRRRERRVGGLAAVALMAAARLGVRAGYAGVLGTDEDSALALMRMREAGVGLEAAMRRHGARPIRSTVVVDHHATRTIFFDLSGFVGADGQWPPQAVIAACRVLLVDHVGVDGMTRAARCARAAGIPVVADFESDDAPRFSELLRAADHLILPQPFAQRITGAGDPAAAAAALWAPDRSIVVVTCGSDGCWWLDGGAAAPVHQRALAVEAAETTGCGDVFHGAYAAALCLGMPASSRIRFATAAAGLKAAAGSAPDAYPTRAHVEAAMARL